MALLDISAWQIDSLRLTAFSNQVIDSKEQNWFSRLTGGIPEQSGARPQQGEYFESGPFMGGVIEVKSAFNRMDCVLTALTQPSSFPKLDGSPDQVVSAFIDRASAWMADLGFPVVRVAFGMGASKIAENREGANRVIMAYVPGVNLDPEAVHNLGIHLSYPFSSAVVPNCEIEPLSKWTSILAQMFTMQPGAMVSTPAIRREHLCRVEFDVFTPADRFEPVANDLLLRLVTELAGASLDVLSKGVRK